MTGGAPKGPGHNFSINDENKMGTMKLYMKNWQSGEFLFYSSLESYILRMSGSPRWGTVSWGDGGIGPLLEGVGPFQRVLGGFRACWALGSVLWGLCLKSLPLAGRGLTARCGALLCPPRHPPLDGDMGAPGPSLLWMGCGCLWPLGSLLALA